MKCPVSMLPGVGTAPSSVLFVIGAIAAITYAIQANKQSQQRHK